MTRFLPAALVVLTGAAIVPIRGDENDKKKDPPPLRYTVRTEVGDRSGLDRDAVLKTLELNAEQSRAWAEDDKAAKQLRRVTLYQEGYVEEVGRGADGRLEYKMSNRAG